MNVNKFHTKFQINNMMKINKSMFFKSNKRFFTENKEKEKKEDNEKNEERQDYDENENNGIYYLLSQF